MIFQSRKWRLMLRIVALVATSVLMLAFAGPVSYALQDDTPLIITGSTQLVNEEEPVSGKYIRTWGAPDLHRTWSVKEGSDTYYWIVLKEHGSQLLVRTRENYYAYPPDTGPQAYSAPSGYFTGKVTELSTRLDADKVVKEMGKVGVAVDKDTTMVLLQGEKPSTYRPMVPVMPVLAWVWLVALVGLVQILRGRKPRQEMSRSAVSARET